MYILTDHCTNINNEQNKNCTHETDEKVKITAWFKLITSNEKTIMINSNIHLLDYRSMVKDINIQSVVG